VLRHGRKPTLISISRKVFAHVNAALKYGIYYDIGGKPRGEIPLGSDYAIAAKKWTDLQINVTTTPVDFTNKYCHLICRIHLLV
jgi:hypothetical protein